jgi:hypothetical protein
MAHCEAEKLRSVFILVQYGSPLCWACAVSCSTPCSRGCLCIGRRDRNAVPSDIDSQNNRIRSVRHITPSHEAILFWLLGLGPKLGLIPVGQSIACLWRPRGTELKM